MAALLIRITVSRAGTLAVLLCAALLTQAVGAQEDSDPVDATDPSAETDISEDNYRRYMELKDPRLERPAFPSTVFKPPSSLEKMAQLPESSQKHLRNQLRGIILQSGPWTPEELEREYRFTPSAAAQQDAQLLRAEAEAWAELVGEYHEREAASLAGDPGAGVDDMAQNPAAGNDAGSSMASSANPGSPGQAQQDGGQQGRGQQGEGQGQQGGDGESRSASASSNDPNRQTAAEETWQDPAEGSPEGMSTEGVAQSASELLRERGLTREGPGLPPATGRGDITVTENNDRWGPEYRTMLPPPAEAEFSTVPETRTDVVRQQRDAAQSAPGTLSLEELRAVQGVTGTLPAGDDGTSDGTTNWGFENDGVYDEDVVEDLIIEPGAPDADPAAVQDPESQ